MTVLVADRDPQRLFDRAQRNELYLRADGLCERCSGLLLPGWQADHVIPWAQGGRTVVANGAALCPHCHLIKTGEDWHAPTCAQSQAAGSH